MSEIDLTQILRLVLSLIFVVSLMGGLALLLKKLGLSGNGANIPGTKKRLRVIETLPLDHRNKAVILQCDDKQHLVILGANGETHIDSDLQAKETHDKTNKKNAV